MPYEWLLAVLTSNGPAVYALCAAAGSSILTWLVPHWLSEPERARQERESQLSFLKTSAELDAHVAARVESEIAPFREQEQKLREEVARLNATVSKLTSIEYSDGLVWRLNQSGERIGPFCSGCSGNGKDVLLTDMGNGYFRCPASGCNATFDKPGDVGARERRRYEAQLERGAQRMFEPEEW